MRAGIRKLAPSGADALALAHQGLIGVCLWLANRALRRGHPHPNLLPSREKGYVDFNSGLVSANMPLFRLDAN